MYAIGLREKWDCLRPLWEAKLALDKLIFRKNVLPPNVPPVPFPVQVHIRSAPQLLNIPMEIAINKAEQARAFVARAIPVVWRLRGNYPAKSERQHGQENVISYDDFEAAISCAGPNVVIESRWLPRQTTIGSVQDILSAVGSSRVPLEITTTDNFEEIVLKDPKRKGNDHAHSFYIVTHGHFDEADVDRCSIAIGSMETGVKHVSASRLSGGSTVAKVGAAFGFLNCCDLGLTATGPQGAAAYTTGFASCLIGAGVCREVIANRWPVRYEPARMLAFEFFNHRPCFLVARAMALLRARTAVFEKYPEDTLLSWLAPVHIVADGELNRSEVAHPVTR